MENIVLLRIGFSLHVIVKICAVEYDEVGGCGRFLGQPRQPIQEIACTPQGSNTLTIS